MPLKEGTLIGGILSIQDNQVRISSGPKMKLTDEIRGVYIITRRQNSVDEAE